MVQRWVCALLLLSVGFAGCIADEPTNTTGTGLPALEVPRPDAIDWALTRCEAAIVLFDVAAEKVQPHLPEGFKPLPVASGVAGLPLNPVNGGSFGIEMFTCAKGIGLNETVESIAYGSYFAFAEPPAELKDATADYHFVKWDVLVPDEARRTLLQDVGVPALNGTATFESFTLDGSKGALRGTLNMTGEHIFEGTTYAPGPAAIRFLEFTAVPDGLAIWKMDATTTAIGLGPGTVTVPAGTLAAEVLGAGTHEGDLMAFKGDFASGLVDLPPEA